MIVIFNVKRRPKWKRVLRSPITFFRFLEATKGRAGLAARIVTAARLAREMAK